LSVSGNDGRHPDVVSKVTVEFLMFSNTTVENSVTIQISRIKAADFLSKYYRALLELLQEELDIGDTLSIYSIDEKDGHIDVYVAISSSQGNCIF
jgi:protocadherin Fat 4